MSEVIHKSHNVSKLMYQFVLPTKYRRVVISDEVEKIIKETCIEISKRYELIFLEIGADKDHVHFGSVSTELLPGTDSKDSKEHNGESCIFMGQPALYGAGKGSQCI